MKHLSINCFFLSCCEVLKPRLVVASCRYVINFAITCVRNNRIPASRLNDRKRTTDFTVVTSIFSRTVISSMEFSMVSDFSFNYTITCWLKLNAAETIQRDDVSDVLMNTIKQWFGQSWIINIFQLSLSEKSVYFYKK